MGERTAVLLDRPRVSPITLDSLRDRLGSNTLQTPEIYRTSLDRAHRVLQRQSGVVWLFQRVPVYALQDVHADSGMIVRFLERKVPDAGGSITLFDALRQGKANAVLLGDVAHSQGSDHWISGRKGSLHATKEELAASMNTQQMAFDLVSEFPNRFVWVRGNHDAQRQTSFGVNNGKNLAIAEAMKKNFGDDVYSEWIQTEDALPYLAANSFVYLSHAAPAGGVKISDVRKKQESVFKKMAGTENRHDSREGMSEEAMRNHMDKISNQLPFEREQHWIWVIGHKPTDGEKEIYRLQSSERLLQIDQREGEVYAVIHPDGTVFVGDCSTSESPSKIKRKVTQIKAKKTKEKRKDKKTKEKMQGKRDIEKKKAA